MTQTKAPLSIEEITSLVLQNENMTPFYQTYLQSQFTRAESLLLRCLIQL